MASPTRRAVLGALLGAGAGGAALSPLSGLLELAAPPAGRTFRNRSPEIPDTVASSHGDATLTFDDHHVPHVEADGEAAAYFAIGYVHAADRLFQMDLIRRLMGGQLSAIVGEATLETDRFHVEMDFRGGARATADQLHDTQTGALVSAYTAGVNARIQDGARPLEYDLLGADPAPWRPLDTYLVGQQIAWALTGGFETLRRAVLRRQLSAHDYHRLYEVPFDHGAPILREQTGGAIEGVGDTTDTARGIDAGFVEALAPYEPSPMLGSNHWAVAGRYTTDGSPILAYDPHLSLTAPPVWYEQHVRVPGVNVRGAAFPGIPFIIVGENDYGAWGFTNAGADVIDFYTYETDGDAYRYDGDWRSIETEQRRIAVADGEDRTVETRKTVHGPFIERTVGGESKAVGVAWTGLSATREPEAIYQFSHTTGVDDYRAALRQLDVPTQNALYVDDDEIYYKLSGRVPIRRVGGEIVHGDRIFDGSAAEGEWEGFEPFGQSTWSGFVPFEEKPGVRDPDYIATANQRLVDEPTYPIGQTYASGFRGHRLYERLDERIRGDTPVDRAFMADLQRDTFDDRARRLVPAILDAADRMDSAVDPWLNALEDWDYRMDRDSRGALVFDRFIQQFRELTWADDFEGLGADFWPAEWRLITLPADDPFFNGDRGAVLAEAMERAIAEITDAGWTVYGDRHRTAIDHQLGGRVDGLNYPRYPTDGTGYTVFNVHPGATHGSSWRQISPIDGESLSILPGGQSGDYFSDHYDDQLRRWADGEYKSMSRAVPDRGNRTHFEHQ